MDLFYLLIILFSCVQSACTKFYNRYSSDVLVFNKLKSFSALVVFALILIGGCTFNLTTVVYGIFYGIFSSISMHAGCAALCMGPMSLTSLIVSFSLIVPSTYGIIFRNERVTLVKALGLVLLFAALVLASVKFGKKNTSDSIKNRGKWLALVFATFFSNGIFAIIQKEHQRIFPGRYTKEFTFVAMVVCAVVFLVPKIKAIAPSNLKMVGGKRYALLSGVLNGLAGFFTLSLAGRENASVLYPVISAGTIIASVVFGKFVFKEKQSPTRLIAFALGVCAVVLLKL